MQETQRKKMRNIIVANAQAFYEELSERHPDNPNLHPLKMNIDKIEATASKMQNYDIDVYNELATFKSAYSKFAEVFSAYHSNRQEVFFEFQAKEKSEILTELELALKHLIEKLGDIRD